MKGYKNPLRRSILEGCGAFIVLLCLTLSALGFVTYYQGMVRNYQTYISDALELTLTELNGEDLKACIESRVKSETFLRAQDFMNRVKEHYDFAFICIVKPLNLNPSDNMMDVMAGSTLAEREEYFNGGDAVTLGGLTGTSYSPDVVRLYLDSMNGEPKTSYYRNRTEFGYMYTGLLPIRDASGNAVAILSADLSMEEIIQTFIRYILILLAEIVVLAALFLSVLYRWLNRRVILPMTRLERAANSFVQSSHGQQNPKALTFDDPDIHTGDELESLSDALSTMTHDMKRFMTNLLETSAEKERIGAELSVATQIQGNMLPNVFPAFPGRKEFDLYATVTPAKEVGGDFYDFFLVDDDHLALVIADASDKGVPAALLMVVTKTIIKNQALSGKSPTEIMEETNRQLYETNGGDMFIKAWLGILELSTGTLRSVNAGHDSPAYCPSRGAFGILEERKGIALAAMGDTRYEENRIALKPGGALFAYTDGLLEAANADGEFFGVGRMLETLNEDAASRPMQTVRRIKKRMAGFVKDTPREDDITMLSLTFFGPRGNAGKA